MDDIFPALACGAPLLRRREPPGAGGQLHGARINVLENRCRVLPAFIAIGRHELSICSITEQLVSPAKRDSKLVPSRDRRDPVLLDGRTAIERAANRQVSGFMPGRREGRERRSHHQSFTQLQAATAFANCETNAMAAADRQSRRPRQKENHAEPRWRFVG